MSEKKIKILGSIFDLFCNDTIDIDVNITAVQDSSNIKMHSSNSKAL